jgi:predicted transcriptional regulator
VKILGIKFGKTSVDDVLEVFNTTISALDTIAVEQQEEARKFREEAIKATELADKAAGESGRARTVLGKIKDLISGEKNDVAFPWPPAAS